MQQPSLQNRDHCDLENVAIKMDCHSTNVGVLHAEAQTQTGHNPF